MKLSENATIILLEIHSNKVLSWSETWRDWISVRPPVTRKWSMIVCFIIFHWKRMKEINIYFTMKEDKWQRARQWEDTKRRQIIRSISYKTTMTIQGLFRAKELSLRFCWERDGPFRLEPRECASDCVSESFFGASETWIQAHTTSRIWHWKLLKVKM